MLGGIACPTFLGLTVNFLFSWPLQSFHPVFHNVPSALGARVALWMCQLWVGTTLVICSLHFDWLCFSVVVSIFNLCVYNHCIPPPQYLDSKQFSLALYSSGLRPGAGSPVNWSSALPWRQTPQDQLS